MIFPASASNGNVECATQNITIFQDLEQEGRESFILSFFATSEYNTDGVTIVSVFIDDDDDGKELQFACTCIHVLL